MSFEQRVEQHHVLDYQSESMLALQADGSILRPYVTESAASGEAVSLVNLYDQLGEMSTRPQTPANNIDQVENRRRRWVQRPDPLISGVYIRTEDMWDSAMSAESELQQNRARQVGRTIDDIILDAITGPVLEGKNSGSWATKNLPASQKLAVSYGSSDYSSGGGGTATGLNPAKIREVRRRLARAYADPNGNQYFMTVSADQIDDLMRFPELTRTDYAPANMPVLQDGRVTKFMGINFLEFQRPPTDDGVETCVAWSKPNVKLKVWADVKFSMWNDTHMQNQPYMHAELCMKGGRLQDEAVLEIPCKMVDA